MTTTPFPISGKVYDVDGSSVVGNIKVVAYDYTKDKSVETTTNSSGEYTLDLANIPGGYDLTDTIYLYAYTNGKHGVVRAILSSSDTSWEQDIYLKEGELVLWDCKVISILASCGDAKSVMLVEKETERIKGLVNVSAGGTINHYFGKPDIVMKGGFWVILAPTGININNQSSGVANAIGDTSSNVTNLVFVNYR